jgi:deazaflavin-dependent oxidoreductase (nitroreductase family)
VRDGDNVAIIASKGGHPRHPGWFHNLRAHPDTTIQIGSRRLAVRARVAAGQERERLWRRAVAVWPPYEDYQKRTGRRIPVVVLKPRPAGRLRGHSLMLARGGSGSAWALAADVVSFRPERNCVVCGASLDCYRIHARYCSGDCRAEVSRLRAILSGSGWVPYSSVAERLAAARKAHGAALRAVISRLRGGILGGRCQENLEEAMAGGVHTPGWVDFNRTDPGVTLIELFAFLGENLLYRQDRLGTANRRTWVQIALSLAVLTATMLAWQCALRRTRRGPADRAGFAKPWGSGSSDV